MLAFLGCAFDVDDLVGVLVAAIFGALAALLGVEEPAGRLGALALSSFRNWRRRSPRGARSAGGIRGGAWHSVCVVVRAVRLLQPVFQEVAAHRVFFAVCAPAFAAAV